MNDELYFEDLCNRFFRKIYTYCKVLVKNNSLDIAEECTHNTFLAAGKQISKLRSHPYVEGWLYTTARNQVNESFRKYYKKQQREVPVRDLLSATLPTGHDSIEAYIASSLDIEELCNDVLCKLESADLELYTLYYRDHTSIAALADLYGISGSAMTTRIYRLKKKVTTIVYKHMQDL